MPRHTYPLRPPRLILPLPPVRQRWVLHVSRPREVRQDFQDTQPVAPIEYLGYEPISTFPAVSAQAAREYLQRSAEAAGRKSNKTPLLAQKVSYLWSDTAAASPRAMSLLPTDAVLSVELMQSLAKAREPGEFAETEPYDAAAAWEDLWRSKRVPNSSTSRRGGWLPKPKLAWAAGGLAVATLVGGIAFNLYRPVDLPSDCEGDPSTCVVVRMNNKGEQVLAQAQSDRTTSRSANTALAPALSASTPPLSRSLEPHRPCKFVGMWIYRGDDGANRTLILQDDGSYLLNPDAVLTGREFTGRWHVQGTQFVWRHDQAASSEPDINTISEEGSDHFVLIELNGLHTRFERVGLLPRNSCKS